MKLTANILAGIIIGFLSFYLGTYVEYSSPSFESFAISWEAVSAIATIAIPFVLYFLGQQEQQRKEKEKANKLKEKIEECKLHLVYYINQTGHTMSTTQKDNSKQTLFPEVLSMIEGSFIDALGMNVSDLKFCKLLQNILCKLQILMYDKNSQLKSNPVLAVFGKSNKGENSYQQTGFYLMDYAQKIKNGDHDKLILSAIEEEY